MTYAYIRVSTMQQSYESQKFEIRRWCKERGLGIDRWIDESASGTIPYSDRVLGRTMRRMGRGDLLVCTEISRLGRNMLMVMSILNDCAARGIRIHTIKDNFDLSDNINSKIIAFAFALAAEIERNLISQRTREALALKKLGGVKLGRPNGASPKGTQLRRDMPKILEMREEGFSMADIARRMGVHRNTLRKYLSNYNG